MKNFIIINGTDLNFVTAESMEVARNYAIDFCDHSEEIIVREIKVVGGFVSRNAREIQERIRELRDSDNHVCPEDKGVGECSCGGYDEIIGLLDNLFIN